jgi:hypothetical protein
MKKLIFKLIGFVPAVGTPIDLSYGGGARLKSSLPAENRMEYNEYWNWVWQQTSKK